MQTAFEVEEGKYGPRLIVRSAWQSEIAEYIHRHQIKELELNYAKGWKRGNLSFLSSIPHLEAFKIIDWKINDISPIHYLNQLRTLEVSTYCKTEINFLSFPNLEKCSLQWRPKAKSLFKSKNLKRLFLNRYTGKDTASFSELVGLQSLSLANCPVRDLDGLKTLKHLSFLSLHRLTKLESISAVAELTNLKALEINVCRKVRSINGIVKLSQLRKLELNDNGDLDSLAGIEALQSLESFLFYGTTNIDDGDLSPLTKLKKLSKLSFKDRKHYSHKLSDFSYQLAND